MKNKKHVTEFEMLQNALSKIRLNEAAIPMHNGKIINDTDTYSKVEKLLACPEMEQSHKFLFDVDFDQLDDDTINKVNELYDLAISQGLLNTDQEEELDATSDVQETPDGVSSEGDVSEVVPSTRNMVNCYTCFYSAIKNGEIKTGECYSNAPSPEQAKVDAISKLTQIGFTDINIIAIETGDTDVANCDMFAHTVETSKPVEEPSSAPVEVDDESTLTEDHSPIITEDSSEDKPEEKEPEEEKKEEPKEEEPKEEEEEEKPTTKDLSHQEKVELFTKFFKTFKDLLIKMKQTSYKNFDIDGKAEFWGKLKEIWNEKYDPKEFMTQANIEKLENMEIKIK